MFRRSWSVFLLSLSLITLLNILHVSSTNLTTVHQPTNLSIEPPLTDFINQSQLHVLEKTIPQEQIEWINASSDEPWASYQQSQGGHRNVRDLKGHLSRRYTDVSRCTDSHRRVVIRNEIHTVTQMLLDAQYNMTLSHPVWRSLISPTFREHPQALERMKALFKTLSDIIIDAQYTVALDCNSGKRQCLQTRNAPDTGRRQVPAAYFNLNENVVNLCGAFFRLPQIENMRCTPGKSMSSYLAMSTSLLHEMVHGIFEPLAQTNYDFITFDLAYGFGACADLAQGTCESPNGGIRCTPLATIANVDTIVWLVYGFYWYNTCLREGKKIPLY